MIKRWAEISCDNCGCAEHFPICAISTEEQAKNVGWIIIIYGRNKLHFDTPECKIAYFNK